MNYLLSGSYDEFRSIVKPGDLVRFRLEGLPMTFGIYVCHEEVNINLSYGGSGSPNGTPYSSAGIMRVDCMIYAGKDGLREFLPWTFIEFIEVVASIDACEG